MKTLRSAWNLLVVVAICAVEWALEPLVKWWWGE